MTVILKIVNKFHQIWQAALAINAHCDRDLDVYGTLARQLLSDLGRKISQCSGEVRETSFLFQRCSVLVQRFNAVLLYNSLPASDCMD